MMITLPDTAGHGPGGSLVVNVSVTEPAATSSGVGVYTAFRAFAFGVKLPAPPLHAAPVALPPIDPARVTEAPPQMVCAGPAFAVAAALMVMVTLLVAATHGRTGALVVRVKVTVPAATSAGVGV